MRGRADTCMTGLVAVLDRAGTAGTTAALHCSRLEDEAAHMLLVDAHTPHRMRCVRINRDKLCGGVCELGGVPREVTSQNERSVTIASQAQLQLTTGFRP